MTLLQGAIAANRFGMGAKPGEIQAASSDPRGWLKAQVRPESVLVPADGLKPVEQTMREQREAYRGVIGPDGKPNLGTPEAQKTIRQMVQQQARDGLLKEVGARSKFAADYGLAVGQLPSVDGQADQLPLLHFAIAGPKGTKTKTSPYVGHPDILKTRAAKQALNFLRLILLHANS